MDEAAADRAFMTGFGAEPAVDLVEFNSDVVLTALEAAWASSSPRSISSRPIER